MKSDITIEKERNFSDVLNVTFDFLRQEFKPFFKTIILYTSIPIILLAIIATFYTKDSFNGLFEAMNGNVPESVTPNGGLLIALIAISVIASIFIIGITFCYLEEYRIHGKDGFEIEAVWQRFIKDFWGLLGFQIVGTIILIISFALLIIPGFYVMIPLSFLLAVKVFEQKGLSDSLSRCFALIKNHWWQTFGILIVITLVHSVLSTLFSIPIAIYSGIKGFLMATDSANTSIDTAPLLVFNIIATIAKYWLYPIVFLAIGFQYFSLKEEKDQTSLIKRINQIGDTEEDANL